MRCRSQRPHRKKSFSAKIELRISQKGLPFPAPGARDQAMAAFPSRKSYRIKARDRILDLGQKTAIMGILNVTPDSFSDGGQYFEIRSAVARAWQIAEEGADILDVGGESTRPGSLGIRVEEELGRIVPILEALSDGYPLPISIDTSKSEVAREALERGACIVNDVSSMKHSLQLGIEAAKCDAALILMHMRGSPSNMQSLPPSPDILGEIEIWAQEAVARARDSGVSSDKIVLDPGIGFGKTAAQNLEILRNLDRLAAAGFPILVGTSRKSFIGAIAKKPVNELVWGTGASIVASIIFGAHMVRVHDVAAMREIVDITDAIVGSSEIS
jgi:dihydropteroate synthase